MSNRYEGKRFDCGNYTMGKLTSLLVMLHNEEAGAEIEEEMRKRGYRIRSASRRDGIVKVVTAIETSAKSYKVIEIRTLIGKFILYTMPSSKHCREWKRDGPIRRYFADRRANLLHYERDSRNIGIFRGMVKCLRIRHDCAPKKGFEHEVLGSGTTIIKAASSCDTPSCHAALRASWG